MSSASNESARAKRGKKVLILGGGFGGVKAALEACQSPALSVTLITDEPDFRYYPTLYRAATGGSRAASAIPFSEIFGDKPVRLIIDEAKTIDRKNKKVKTAAGKSYGYDSLVVSLGVITNFFGIKGLSKYAYGIKTLAEARRLRDHLHKQLIEEAAPDPNYVIIGGGPTGVELAGAMAGYIRLIMKKHGLKRKSVHIDLVEAAPRLLPRMPKAYSRAVHKRLRRLGVHIYLSQKVEAQTASELMVSGHPVDSHTVVWTAGVTNHPFLKRNQLEVGSNGKTQVDQFLQAEPGIYVIGDNADTPYSGLAQTALCDGLFVGRNLAAMAEGKPATAYNPKRPIYITPIGRRWAAVLWGRTQIYGLGGWLLRNLADFVGYHDLEPILPASKHWLAQFDSQENCLVCFNSKASKKA